MSESQRCERAAQETGGLWACTREAGHDGPCAAVAVPAMPVGVGTCHPDCVRVSPHEGGCQSLATLARRPGAETCGASWDFYVTGHTLATYHVTCALPAGHDLDHRGEIGWPS